MVLTVHGHSPETFQDRFGLSLLLSVPVVFSAWDVLLSPAVGAVLMSASTVIVALNAQLLKRVEL